MLPGKDKLNKIQVIFSKTLINSDISHDEFVSVNNVLRGYTETKEEIKNYETSVKQTISKQWKPIVSVVRKILPRKIEVSKKLNKILIKLCCSGQEKINFY